MNTILEKFLTKADPQDDSAAQVFDLIDAYYQRVVDNSDEENKGSDLYNDGLFPAELKQPVNERKSGICDAILYLLGKGCNINKAKGGFNAMMLAVGAADAPMVEFLLKNGATVHEWPDMTDDPNSQNYYLESIDLGYMHEGFSNDPDQEYLDALMKTASVLVRVGGLRSFSGFCLTVDEEGHGSIAPAKVLY